MEPRKILSDRFQLPKKFLNEFLLESLAPGFDPNIPLDSNSVYYNAPTLITVDLQMVLKWLFEHPVPRIFENEPCTTPILLHVPNFSVDHILFYYDGSSSSVDLIDHFLIVFAQLISESKATIISPSFIPKSRLKEEEEVIQKIRTVTKETSFIKLNFSKIGDFWCYAVQNNCNLLVINKKFQSELSKILFNFYSKGIWDENLSFYLSL
ncbi:hypothetical protein JYB64_13260 [Algoriphagus aestuarii]|nr:hypothetical protein [Algoriphagus aestuarii]